MIATELRSNFERNPISRARTGPNQPQVLQVFMGFTLPAVLGYGSQTKPIPANAITFLCKEFPPVLVFEHRQACRNTTTKQEYGFMESNHEPFFFSQHTKRKRPYHGEDSPAFPFIGGCVFPHKRFQTPSTSSNSPSSTGMIARTAGLMRSGNVTAGTTAFNPPKIHPPPHLGTCIQGKLVQLK